MCKTLNTQKRTNFIYWMCGIFGVMNRAVFLAMFNSEHNSEPFLLDHQLEASQPRSMGLGTLGRARWRPFIPFSSSISPKNRNRDSELNVCGKGAGTLHAMLREMEKTRGFTSCRHEHLILFLKSVTCPRT